MLKQKVRTVSSITVGEFYERHKEKLKLTIVGKKTGHANKIQEPALNRPGLALTGYFDHFPPKRIQLLGDPEVSYLFQLDKEGREKRINQLCDLGFPCLVITRRRKVPEDVIKILADRELPVFKTSLSTMKCLNQMTYRLEKEFAKSTSLHGCMLDYHGIGVLIAGDSGSGKSEAALGLLERGAALVADDLVRVKQLGSGLFTECAALAQGFIEMRGIGIINVSNLYGLGAIRPNKQLDLVVLLKPASDLNNVDRIGMNRKTAKIIDAEIPIIEIPVAPGRDTARLISVAALDMQLRKLGYDMADEFNRKLLAKMEVDSNKKHRP